MYFNNKIALHCWKSKSRCSKSVPDADLGISDRRHQHAASPSPNRCSGHTRSRQWARCPMRRPSSCLPFKIRPNTAAKWYANANPIRIRPQQGWVQFATGTRPCSNLKVSLNEEKLAANAIGRVSFSFFISSFFLARSLHSPKASPSFSSVCPSASASVPPPLPSPVRHIAC